MRKSYIIEKLGSLLFVVLAIIIFNPSQLLNLLIVMGQGHFILAYLYQYKAGKIGKPFVLKYILLFLVLFLIFTKLLPLEWMVVIVGTQFLIHFLQDEIFLFKEKHSLFTSIETVMLSILYFGILHAQMFTNSTITSYTIPIAIGLLGIYGVLALKNHYRPLIPSYPILIGMLVLIGIGLRDISIPAEILLGSIILFHYCEWYIHFYLKLKNNAPALHTYITRFLVVNAVIALLYFTYVYYFQRSGLLQILFAVFYFYLWTLMHTITSIRKEDYMHALDIPST